MVRTMFKDLSTSGVSYVYVHNWAGFDSLYLLKYLELDYKIDPFTFDGNLLSLRVSKKTGKGKTLLYTIKDSLKLLPLSQSDLTRSFEVETQKGSFPHYFDPREHTVDGSVHYKGPLPAYQYYESSRTSPEEYAQLQETYQNQLWDYDQELERYQMDDCKSLHQVIRKYSELTYTTLGVDVHKTLSIPGATYKLWQGLENPKLQSSGTKVYKLPKNV